MTTLIGKKAPSFKTSAVINGIEIVHDYSLDQFIDKKNVILFFYPKDFTFVCPTELHAFQAKLKDFEKRETAVIACSTDTEQSHWGWLQLDKNKGGIKGVAYPILADTNKTISSNFGVLNGSYTVGNETLNADAEMIAYRGLFLIDKKGVIRHLLINDLPLGRNVDEALRMVDALRFYEENGEVCPANWREGETAMVATHEGVAEFFSNN
jgi:peroxiredoxin (alkyl hydroperoxide reductase subunit C)